MPRFRMQPGGRLAPTLAIDGEIIIAHDANVRGPTTVRVLDELIPALKRRGYVFERLDEAFAYNPVVKH